MKVAPFPTLARPVQRVTSEVWLAFDRPVARGDLRSHELASAGHVIDARDAVAHPGDLLEVWLAAAELTCCSLRIGLQIYVDGALWTEGTTDHFWHLGGWATLAEALLEGTPASTFVWDESSLSARIDGDRAMIWDEHVLSRGRTSEGWWPIRCERAAMARAISEAGATIDALRGRIIGALEARFDRNALPKRLDPARDKPRAIELLDKAAVIDREVARGFDTLAFRALAARLATR